MYYVLYIPCLLLIFITIIRLIIDSNNQGEQQNYMSQDHNSLLSMEENRDDGRRLFGSKLYSRDDWDRWNVLKGFSYGIYAHLKDLEKGIESEKTTNAAEMLEEWFAYYQKYRTLCLNIGCWNECIGDKKPFTASSSQLQKEKKLKEDMQLRYEAVNNYRKSYWEHEQSLEQYREAIKSYILSQPYHVARRTDMLKHISAETGMPYKELSAICSKMIKDGILSQKKNGNRYEIKIARKKPQKKPPVLPPSNYYPGNYVNVTRHTLYKVDYTVGRPINVDKTKNTCEFISESTGEKYYTSLEKCTCSAFSRPVDPCKHMVALAIHLGYYNRSSAKSN